MKSAAFALVVAFALGPAGVQPARASDDGAWLEKAADQAVVAGQYARAVALLRGLGALRPRDPTADYRLAEVYTLAGQYDAAVEAYRRFAARPEADPARKAHADAEARRLEESPPPFADALFRPAVATPEARRLFDVGKRDAHARRWQSSINELQAALLLDPELPGPYRLLGAVYGKTGDRAQEYQFLAEYLRVRPAGSIAETVRRTLRREHLLGTLSVDASFPCKVYIDGHETGRMTPLRRFGMPPGKYVVSLENEHYHIVRNLRVEVAADKDTERFFGFGVLTTKLEPWARVRVDGKDIGLWDEAGIPEGKHNVVYKSHDGSKERSVQLEIKAGARQKLSW